MTTILEAMTARALAEFDELAMQQEQAICADLRAQGFSRNEIKAHIANCKSSLAEQRAEIGRMVANQLTKAGIPLDGDAHALSH
ncbi:hypothetical protein [Caenibius sp. WL]|uniref:hypothetical protein n=1 Tax=Caenibius sp. WL TaxID=2872646 RepID=UPI001C9917D1|nr:hypothetical protein [Caenibius sp. WL]QZP08194.1 hypothetical protein K5X80_16435 [Caenibius sp. WL]